VAIVFLASDAAAWITGETMVSTAACGSATLSRTDAESMPVTEVLEIVGIDPAGGDAVARQSRSRGSQAAP
jgi:hypothetical protein